MRVCPSSISRHTHLNTQITLQKSLSKMNISTGTTIALLGTAALTLPSLLSVYYKQLNIPQPPLSVDTIPHHVNFIYRVRPEFRILSPPYTIVTHIFHHHDIGYVLRFIINNTRSMFDEWVGGLAWQGAWTVYNCHASLLILPCPAKPFIAHHQSSVHPSSITRPTMQFSLIPRSSNHLLITHPWSTLPRYWAPLPRALSSLIRFECGLTGSVLARLWIQWVRFDRFDPHCIHCDSSL